MTIVKAVDVASYQPRDLSAIISEHQPQHCIIHLYHDQESPPFAHSAAQVQSALDNGCTVGGYCFLYPGTDMVRMVNSVADRCASIGLVLPILWLDVESFNGQDITPGDLAAAVSHSDALGIPTGIYTSREMWRRIGSPTGFQGLPLWAAQYDGQPTLESLLPVPNLPLAVAHQYRGDPLDLNVMLEEYTVLPTVDPCAALRSGLLEITTRKPYKAPPKKTLVKLLEA